VGCFIAEGGGYDLKDGLKSRELEMQEDTYFFKN
jgi:hypothetical protein